ncbi:MAG: NAD(P)(+) transhydrogenase (Re/Si-specific) subunit beta, partial [Pseudomonadota bacterium]
MDTLINLGYLAAAVLFILGIKGMTTPKTAVRGNQMSATGMLIAIIVALLDNNVVTYEYIVIGVLIGGTIGAILAKKTAMTDMPELVAALNGIGGGASLLVAAANYLESQKLAEMGQFVPSVDWSIAVIMSILIGA